VPETFESWAAGSYALSHDGSRFLMLKDTAAPASILVALNWTRELERVLSAR